MEVEIELYINAWFRFSGTMCIRKYGLMPAQPRNVFGLLWNKTTTRPPNVSRSTLVGWTDEESRRNRRMDPDSAWCNAKSINRRILATSFLFFFLYHIHFFFFRSYTNFNFQPWRVIPFSRIDRNMARLLYKGNVIEIVNFLSRDPSYDEINSFDNSIRRERFFSKFYFWYILL